MSNLPKDLEEDMLSRVSVTSMRKVRSTCKTWNILSKDKCFAKKHLDQATTKKSMMIMMMNFRIYLMSINLNEKVESCLEPESKLISQDDSYNVDICKVFHCNGLFLCITKDHTNLVVWNPYWGQARWIKPTHSFHGLDCYSHALGYDKKSLSYKILTFIDVNYPTTFVEIKIYNLNSDSWRVIDVVPDWQIDHYNNGVSLNGDAYWCAKETPLGLEDDAFLVCFDFTKERFGPPLCLPFQWYSGDTVTLSSVKEEKLAVLFQRCDTLMLEIWITTKITPNTVSWSSKVFLAVNMIPLTDFQFNVMAASFFTDEEKNVVVVFDKNRDDSLYPTQNIAYIVGIDESLKKAYLGESSDINCYPLSCSYVPSLEQLN